MDLSSLFSQTREKIFLVGVAVTIAAWLHFLNGLAWMSSLVFFAALLVVYYIPGNLLLILTKQNRASLLFDFVESTALGLALVPVVYIVIRRCGCEFLISYLLAAIALMWIVVKVRRREATEKAENSFKQLVVGFSGLVILVLILLQYSHYSDVVRTTDALKIRNSPLTETVYHQGIVNSLKYNFPPPQIYASGSEDYSSYHLYMHLEIELLARLFPLQTIDLVFYYFPTVYFLLISLLPFAFFTERYNSPAVGALVGTLAYGADFSFVPGLLKLGFVKYSTYPWVFYFPNTIWSTFTLNGYLPSIFVLFLSLIYLHRYFKDHRLADLMIYSLLVFASAGFKTTMGLHLSAVGFAFGTLLLFQMEKRRSCYLFLAAMLGTVTLIVFDVFVFRGGTGGAQVAFKPLSLFYEALPKLGLGHPNSYFLPVMYVVFIVATFGVRIGGFYYLKNFIRPQVDYFPAFLALFCLSGFIVSECFVIGYEGDMINNASWFASQSLICAWFLFGILFKNVIGHISAPARIVALVLTIVLVFPSTAEFLTKRYENKYISYDKNALGVVDYLQGVDKNSVILNLPELEGPSLAANLAGRTTYLSQYMSFLKKKDRVADRISTASLFFRDTTDGAVKKYLLNKLGIDYIYAPISYAQMLMPLPFLRLVYSNGEYLILKVK